MTHSFTLAMEGSHSQAGPDERRKVLVTGASGSIGSYFCEHSHDKYDLRMMVHDAEKGKGLQQYGEVVAGELNDLEALKRFCEGIDTVVHLAANPHAGAVWEDLLEPNIIGVYNMYTAAKAAGCRRLIFASSIHAVIGYPREVQVKTSEPVNPGDMYGVTKCFGEALGRYMAEKEGLSVIALRIGGFGDIERARQREHPDHSDGFVSKDDLTQLIQRCIEAENLQFAIFHALSDTRHKRLDISDARALVGYDPQDDPAR